MAEEDANANANGEENEESEEEEEEIFPIQAWPEGFPPTHARCAVLKDILVAEMQRLDVGGAENEVESDYVCVMKQLAKGATYPRDAPRGENVDVDALAACKYSYIHAMRALSVNDTMRLYMLEAGTIQLLLREFETLPAPLFQVGTLEGAQAAIEAFTNNTYHISLMQLQAAVLATLVQSPAGLLAIAGDPEDEDDTPKATAALAALTRVFDICRDARIFMGVLRVVFAMCGSSGASGHRSIVFDSGLLDKLTWFIEPFSLNDEHDLLQALVVNIYTHVALEPPYKLWIVQKAFAKVMALSERVGSPQVTQQCARFFHTASATSITRAVFSSLGGLERVHAMATSFLRNRDVAGVVAVAGVGADAAISRSTTSRLLLTLANFFCFSHILPHEESFFTSEFLALLLPTMDIDDRDYQRGLLRLLYVFAGNKALAALHVCNPGVIHHLCEWMTRGCFGAAPHPCERGQVCATCNLVGEYAAGTLSRICIGRPEMKLIAVSAENDVVGKLVAMLKKALAVTPEQASAQAPVLALNRHLDEPDLARQLCHTLFAVVSTAESSLRLVEAGGLVLLVACLGFQHEREMAMNAAGTIANVADHFPSACVVAGAVPPLLRQLYWGFTDRQATTVADKKAVRMQAMRGLRILTAGTICARTCHYIVQASAADYAADELRESFFRRATLSIGNVLDQSLDAARAAIDAFVANDADGAAFVGITSPLCMVTLICDPIDPLDSPDAPDALATAPNPKRQRMMATATTATATATATTSVHLDMLTRASQFFNRRFDSVWAGSASAGASAAAPITVHVSMEPDVLGIVALSLYGRFDTAFIAENPELAHRVLRAADLYGVSSLSFVVQSVIVDLLHASSTPVEFAAETMAALGQCDAPLLKVACLHALWLGGDAGAGAGVFPPIDEDTAELAKIWGVEGASASASAGAMEVEC